MCYELLTRRRIYMKLNEGIIGYTYRVESVSVNETITRRLEALGVNNMTPGDPFK